MKKKMMKCLICGAIFDPSVTVCPVCGVGPDNFEEIEVDDGADAKNSESRYVILGGGIAAVAAAEAIRERDKGGSITILSNEQVLPYNRPMLTKIMTSDLSGNKIVIHAEQWYQDRNIKLRLGTVVTGIDTARKQILIGGETLDYDKCIYALGASCFIPPIPGSKNNPRVIAIRCIEDVKKVQEALPEIKKAVIIGGGVLGLEAAWALRKAGKEAEVLEAAPQIMGRQIDAGAAEELGAIARKRGIEIHTGVKITEITGYEDGLDVVTGDGMYPCQLVLVSAGVRANTEIASLNGITVNRAIVVNDKMETNIPDLFAAGDCAEYNGINYALWAEAEAEGKTAGANAAGGDEHYIQASGALSFFGMETKLYALGDNGKKADTHYKIMEISDKEKELYTKCYFVDDRLSGVTLIGDLSKMKALTRAVGDGLSFAETLKLF